MIFDGHSIEPLPKKCGKREGERRGVLDIRRVHGGTVALHVSLLVFGVVLLFVTAASA